MEYSVQYLLLLLTFIGIVSVISLGFVLRVLDVNMCWQDDIRYYKVYFLLALITSFLNFISLTFNISSQLIIMLVIYIIVHVTMLLALEKKFRRKATALVSAVLLSAVLSTYFFFQLDDNAVMMIYALLSLVYFSGVSYISLQRARHEDNKGYYLFTAAFVMVIISSVAILFFRNSEISSIYIIALAGNSIAFTLVIIGFLALTLINEHKKLQLLAIKDTLTGMNNRRGLQIMLDTMIPMLNRNKKCVSVITIDIDFFKKINDTYGHDGGDIVLKEFSQLIMTSHRKSDISGRLGGEEFVLVLPDTDKEGAFTIAEKLRSSTEELDIEIEGRNINITASFGVASSCMQTDIDSLLKDADKALYVAKYSGRNRVCHSEDDKKPSSEDLH